MIHFVVALLPEAKPLIDYYHLKALPHLKPFKLYEGDGKRLIISGIGKARAANATVFLHTFSGNVKNQAWLNIGIGGHAKHALGDGILAHKITDQATNESWYPPIVFESPCPTESVLTVAHPEMKYRTSQVYDMEAAGFYSTATRFSSAELVQCYKVISDNPESSTKKISAAFVENLIADHLKNINAIVKELTKLRAELAGIKMEPAEFQKLISHWHFTVSEQHRLSRFLKRFKIVMPEEKVWSNELQTLKRAKDVLKFLEESINSAPVTL